MIVLEALVHEEASSKTFKMFTKCQISMHC